MLALPTFEDTYPNNADISYGSLIPQTLSIVDYTLYGHRRSINACTSWKMLEWVIF